MERIVVQRHGFGCGVACVAYAAGVSYKKALSLFAHPENAEAKGYWCRDLIAALAVAGLAYQHRYFKPRHRKFLKDTGVIVYTRRSAKYPAGHYLVRTKSGLWMNPWANFPEMNPRIAALQKRLPGTVSYILIPDRLISTGAKSNSFSISKFD